MKQIYLKPQINKEFCYLIGVGLGDGYCSVYDTKSGYKKYNFGLATIDKDFALKFKNCLYKVTSKKLKILTRIEKTKTPNNKTYITKFFGVQLQRKEDVKFFKSYINDLNWIWNLNNKLKAEIIKGLFDSEGSVSIRHFARFGQKNTKLFRDLLKDINIIDFKWYIRNEPNPLEIIQFRKEGLYKLWLLYNKKLTIKRKNKIVKKIFEGLCLNCKNKFKKIKINQKFCQLKCGEKFRYIDKRKNGKAKEKWKELKLRGLCTRCGKEKEDDYYIKCKKCREYYRRYYQENKEKYNKNVKCNVM